MSELESETTFFFSLPLLRIPYSSGSLVQSTLLVADTPPGLLLGLTGEEAGEELEEEDSDPESDPDPEADSSSDAELSEDLKPYNKHHQYDEYVKKKRRFTRVCQIG